MKRISIYLILSLSILPVTLIGQGKSAADLMYEAIYHEEVTGDLDKAVTLLNEVLKNCTDKRIECAQALYHLGLVVEMKAEGRGQKAKGKEEVGKVKSLKGAEAYYVQIIEKYPEVGDYAELARGRLAKLKDANTFVDPRDGHKYRWVKIGDQVWMAENLAYMPHVNPPKKQEWGIWVYDYDGEDVAEAKATENYQKYGCLYDWTMAMDIDPKYLGQLWNGDTVKHQGLCPQGWHLPTDGEWKVMEKYLGLPDSLLDICCDIRGGDVLWDGVVKHVPPVGKYLKSASEWNSDGSGDNRSGFIALPGGQRIESEKAPSYRNFEQLGYIANFWTASVVNSEVDFKSGNPMYTAYHRYLYYNDFCIWRDQYADRTQGGSVRCVKDDNNDSDREFGNTNVASTNQQKIAAEILDFTEEKRVPSKLLNRFLTPGSIGLPPVIHEGRIFVGCYNCKALYSLDINTLDTIWAFHSVSSLNGQLIVAGNFLIARNKEKLFALSTDKGNVVWEKDWPVYHNSVVSDGILYTFQKNTFYAINLINGDEIWSYKAVESTFGRPLVSNGIVYCPLPPSGAYDPEQIDKNHPILLALDAKTGKKLWDYQSPGYMWECSYSDGLILISPNSIRLGGYLIAIDAISGSIVWRYYLGKSGLHHIVVSDSNLYILTSQVRSGKLFSITMNGKTNWVRNLPEGPFIYSQGPLVYNDQIFFYTINLATNKVTLSSTDLKKATKNVSIDLPVQPKSYPIINNNRMFIGCADGLYIFEVPKLD